MTDYLTPEQCEWIAEDAWTQLRRNPDSEGCWALQERRAKTCMAALMPWIWRGEGETVRTVFRSVVRLRVVTKELQRGVPWANLSYTGPPAPQIPANTEVEEPAIEERTEEPEEPAVEEKTKPAEAERDTKQEDRTDPGASDLILSADEVGHYLSRWPTEEDAAIFSLPPSRPKPREEKGCFNCGDPGHRYADCGEKRRREPFCRICGRRPYTVRTCPTCGQFYASEVGAADRDLRRLRAKEAGER